MLNFFFRKKTSYDHNLRIRDSSDVPKISSRLSFAWILTGKLAIGPMPRLFEDWDLLEKNGLKKRFSCCYPEEHVFIPPPEDWLSREVSLPDHRKQEELTVRTLIYSLREALTLLSLDDNPLYLHCFAGQERSSLIATGIVSLIEKKDLLDSLAYVRQCYPKARPLYEQLDILDQALKDYHTDPSS